MSWRAESGFIAVRNKFEPWVEQWLRNLPEPERTVAAEDPTKALEWAKSAVEVRARKAAYAERARRNWERFFPGEPMPVNADEAEKRYRALIREHAGRGVFQPKRRRREEHLAP